MNPDGGPAIPVQIVTGTGVEGGPAIPVYGYATLPADGRMVEGRPARRVVVIGDSDLVQNGGNYVLEGRPFALPVMTAPAGAEVEGNIPIAVYPVNSWPTTTPPWYLSGGIALADCLIAYQPKGVASYAASLLNLKNPGTDDATESGAAPGWDAVNGWKSTGQKLVAAASFYPDDSCTVIARFSDLTTPSGTLFGEAEGGKDFYQLENGATSYFSIGNAGGNRTSFTAGVLGMSSTQAYKDGLPDGAAFAPAAFTSTLNICIFDRNGAANPSNAYIQAFVIYSVILTDAQHLAVATAMAAL